MAEKCRDILSFYGEIGRFANALYPINLSLIGN
jgi:hypothetical protein